jgi:putative PIN family toxin of toxin-antitoxin system
MRTGRSRHGVRVVLDTNVIVSGLNFAGNEERVLELARARTYDLYFSRFILEEVRRVLRNGFAWSPEDADEVVELLASWAMIVEPRIRVSVVQRDESDNRILECAVAAEADYLVTGDKRHLLPLIEFRRIKIVTTAEFLNMVLA